MPRNDADLAIASALPTEAECAAVGDYLDNAEAKAPMARTKVEMKSGVTHLSFDHVDQAVGLALVANVFGTGSSHFASGVLGQLADVSRTGAEVKSTELDFMLKCRSIGGHTQDRETDHGRSTITMNGDDPATVIVPRPKTRQSLSGLIPSNSDPARDFHMRRRALPCLRQAPQRFLIQIQQSPEFHTEQRDRPVTITITLINHDYKHRGEP